MKVTGEEGDGRAVLYAGCVRRLERRESRCLDLGVTDGKGRRDRGKDGLKDMEGYETEKGRDMYGLKGKSVRG